MTRLAAPNKYHSIRQNYNGYNYHSKLEAEWAGYLDRRLELGEIAGWERQFKVELFVNGHRITNYFVDFRIEHLDGSYELLEVKGMETDVWLLKVRLLYAAWLPDNQDHRYTVVKKHPGL